MCFKINHIIRQTVFFLIKIKLLTITQQEKPKTTQEFVDAYSNDSDEYERVIKWFKTLPLWLEFDDFRVTHACWDDESINLIKDFQNGSNILSDELLCESVKQDAWQHSSVEMLIKGK